MAWTPDGALLLLTARGLMSADPRSGELTALEAPAVAFHRLAVRG